ncbi:MAG: LD-carboxypeptidase [Desulfobulbus propionicus]|nr:MAG: LD-carboxypeptidase [Desulfobulbus propionicus]
MKQETNPIFPPRLKKGDTVGVFCPAGPVRDIGAFERGVQILKRFGLAVKVQGNVYDQGSYLADADQQRANNLHVLFDDDTVAAIMAARGGFGCMRMLPYVDFELIQKKPKLLIGFSDVTVLLGALVAQANTISIHGPVVTSLATSNDRSIHQLLGLVSGDGENVVKGKQLEILRKGSCRGILAGGNLTTLVHLIGTRWEHNLDNRILVLEDTGEHVYRLDRMLTQLAMSGKLDRIAGILLGSFDTGGGDALQNQRLEEQVWTRVLELTEHLNLPVWGRFPVGHLAENLALPFGLPATMDENNGTLQFHFDCAQFL